MKISFSYHVSLRIGLFDISSTDNTLSPSLSNSAMICSLNTLSGKCVSINSNASSFYFCILLASTVLSSVTTSFSGVAGVSCFALSSFKVSAFSAVSSCSLSVIFSCTSAFFCFLFHRNLLCLVFFYNGFLHNFCVFLCHDRVGSPVRVQLLFQSSMRNLLQGLVFSS